MAEAGTGASLRITSRRYLGAKSDLVPDIREIVRAECGEVTSFLDAFAGTGAVAAGFNAPGVAVLANDILYANYVCLSAFLETHEPADLEAAARLLPELEALDPDDPRWRDDYVARHFGGKYFTVENARRIGAIRERIAQLDCPEQARRLLLTSLLYAVDKVANTCGHYDAYRQTLDQTAQLRLRLPEVALDANRPNRVYQQDANALVRETACDVLFLDPPYNSRQYSDTYHVLENLARWQKPPVFGKAAKFDRASLKSRYCTREAAKALADLVLHCRARFVVLTYNSMGGKGDSRSNARISDEEIREVLETLGPVSLHVVEHRLFSAGKSEHRDNVERVFVCRNRRLAARRVEGAWPRGQVAR